jgi:2-aminoadipate transaminase
LVAYPFLARRAARLPGALPDDPPETTITFESGHAFPAVMPDLTAAAERALTLYRAETLQYGPRMGLPELRSWIAEYCARDGVRITSENVLMTNGAKQAIELVCRLMLDEGDSIVVTAPTYYTAIPIFRSFGVKFIEVGVDADGLNVEELADRIAQLKRERQPLPKFIYNVPDFHNPTGVTMSLKRRRALIDLALRERIFVVEDSPYRAIRYEGEHLPSLKALDPSDVVFYIGTFSKVMTPGIRVGWVSASPGLTARLAQLKADGGSSPLAQRIVLEFCAAGHLAAHTSRVRTTYRVHRDRMLASLREHLPQVSVKVPSGGYYLWLTLPPDVDGDHFAKRAADAGVSVLGPSRCYAEPGAGHPMNHVRAAFTHATPEEIDQGVRRLVGALRSRPSGRAAVAVP